MTARSRRRGHLNRGVLVAAAMEIADHQGIEGVSLAAVAAKLHCAAPSLYNHVDGLDDLLDSVQIECTRQLAEHLRDAAVGRAGRDAVVAFAEAWRDFGHRFPSRYRLVFRPMSTAVPEHIAAVDSAIRTSRIVQASMGISDDVVPGASSAIRAYLEGFTAIEGRETVPDADQTFNLGLSALLDGIEERARQHTT